LGDFRKPAITSLSNGLSTSVLPEWRNVLAGGVI
jgi:hypothetical protein